MRPFSTNYTVNAYFAWAFVNDKCFGMVNIVRDPLFRSRMCISIIQNVIHWQTKKVVRRAIRAAENRVTTIITSQWCSGRNMSIKNIESRNKSYLSEKERKRRGWTQEAKKCYDWIDSYLRNMAIKRKPEHAFIYNNFLRTTHFSITLTNYIK